MSKAWGWLWGSGEKKEGEEAKAPEIEVALEEPVTETLAKHREAIDAARKTAGIAAGDANVDDVVIYRYLRGFNFNLEQASAALAKMYKWRKDNKLDEIRPRIRDLKQAEYPNYAKANKAYAHNVHSGYDKKGQPVGWFKLGLVDPATMMASLTVDELVEYHLYVMEYRAELLARLTKETGKVTRVCNVVDLTGLSLRHLNRAYLKYFRATGDVSQDYYAETVGNIYIINPPWAFQMLWRIIKPMLRDYTLAKLAVLDGPEWQKELQKKIDAKYIPKEWGGAAENVVPDIDNSAGFTKVDIGARAKFEVKEKAEEKDVLVSWEFKTAAKNISFGVKFLPDAGGEERWLREVEAVDSHIDVQSAGVRCSEPGTVILVWDNTASLLTGKTLFYRVDKVLEKIVERERRATLVFKYAPGQADKPDGEKEEGKAAEGAAPAAAPADAAPAAAAAAGGGGAAS
jgi:hypothetical protein